MDTILVDLRSRKLDGVLSPNDTLARGILDATKARRIEYPSITNDAEKPSDKLILEEHAVLPRDTRKLGKTRRIIVNDVLKDKMPRSTTTTT